jgi:hypothetical protein
VQVAATKAKTVDEINRVGFDVEEGAAPTLKRRPTRARQKMLSTPVGVSGSSLFGQPPLRQAPSDIASSSANPVSPLLMLGAPAQTAEITLDGETYTVRVSNDAANRVRQGHDGTLVGREITVNEADIPVEHRLKGFVRKGATLKPIAESGLGEDEH